MTIPRCSLIHRPEPPCRISSAAHRRALSRAPTGGGAASITDSKDNRLCKPYITGKKTPDTSTQLPSKAHTNAPRTSCCGSGVDSRCGNTTFILVRNNTLARKCCGRCIGKLSLVDITHSILRPHPARETGARGSITTYQSDDPRGGAHPARRGANPPTTPPDAAIRGVAPTLLTVECKKAVGRCKRGR